MLKVVLETLDGIDEAVQSLYAEKDGAFVLQIDGVDSHPDVANLKSAYERVKADRDAVKAERDEAKSRINSLPDDFDPEKWAKLKDGKPDEAVMVKLRQEMESKIADLEGQLNQTRETARRNALDRDLTDALTEAGVTNPTFAKAARQMLADGVKVGEDGKPFVETDMGPLGLSDHVKRWAATEGKDFVTAASGGGAKGSAGAKGTKKWGEMTSAEKVALRRENPQAYDAAKTAG